MILDLREQASRAPVALPPLSHLFADVRATWRGRMINEHASSAVFAGLARQLGRAGLGDDLVRQCEIFAAEERRHGVLCGAVVEAAGGEARAPALPPEAFPDHDEVAPLEGVLRNVISVCCLSETAAVALIGAERLRMEEGPLRELMTSIYADEVGHSRFGWQLAARLVPTLDHEAKARLSAYLAVAFAHLEAHELAHLPEAYDPPAEGHALGLCRGSDARRLLYDAIDEVMIPGLSRLGLEAGRAFRLRHRAAAATAA
ncbi:MAG: ferritin-like domain-containing protein [Polyangiaceae bacterium]